MRLRLGRRASRFQSIRLGSRPHGSLGDYALRLREREIVRQDVRPQTGRVGLRREFHGLNVEAVRREKLRNARCDRAVFHRLLIVTARVQVRRRVEVVVNDTQSASEHASFAKAMTGGGRRP